MNGDADSPAVELSWCRGPGVSTMVKDAKPGESTAC